jgi:hypothetical protein
MDASRGPIVDQIVTIRFSIPAGWSANTFAEDIGECFAEANPDDADVVALLDVKSQAGD